MRAQEEGCACARGSEELDTRRHESGNPETIAFSQLLDGEVEDALRRLPMEFLEVVVMVDIQDLSYEETATAIGCPIGTVRARLSRGRRMLQAAVARSARERGFGRGGNYALR